jgi:hypothetical protein
MGDINLTADQAFENTSTNVAASQMRNALNKLSDTVTDPNEKKVSTCPYPWTAPHLTTWMLIFAALRDGNGQLLRPLPAIPQ